MTNLVAEKKAEILSESGFPQHLCLAITVGHSDRYAFNSPPFLVCLNMIRIISPDAGENRQKTLVIYYFLPLMGNFIMAINLRIDLLPLFCFLDGSIVIMSMEQGILSVLFPVQVIQK